jgi:hypothetical protein
VGRWFGKSAVKAPGLTGRGQWILPGLNMGEVTGIPGVAVKCVDIRRNIDGESRSLDHY